MTSKSSAFQSDFDDVKNMIAENRQSDPHCFYQDTIFVKYNFYWFNKQENDKQYSILIELPLQCTVKEAMQRVIPYFNMNLEKKTHFRLATDPKAFDLYSAKKNGQPKTDYPGNDSHTLVVFLHFS